ncbi:MAG: DNA repair protein RecO [Chitinispirillaceae bacterium]|nr:DNA repair protein RecO [Chitinispirillaceae bacterium]
MAIGKTHSVVLSVTPYRESSILAVLFSREHGRFSGIAKGIRRGDRRRVPVERGYIIEHIVYLKQHGDLHQITDCSIHDYFPLLRGDLEKTAIRDLLFDIVLSAVPAGDSHPDVYDFIVEFLTGLSNVGQGLRGHLTYLSKILFAFSGHLGFGLDFSQCSSCGYRTDGSGPVWLNIEQGMVRCERCSSGFGASADRLVSAGAAIWFSSSGSGDAPVLSGKEAVAALRLAYDYSRYHLEIRKNLESYAFVEHLAGM